MSKFYDELMTGLNEAVKIEHGSLKGRKTVYEIQPVKNTTMFKSSAFELLLE